LLEGKQEDELWEKIKQIPLSDSTAMRSEILAEDVTSQLPGHSENQHEFH
jgi:hypothetical protein